MNELIKNLLTDIQSSVQDNLESIASGLRVSSNGNLQIFLKEQCDSSVQENFKSSIETLDSDLTVTYQDNLDEFGDPTYYNNNGKKQELSPAIVIHPIREPKSVEDMFSDLDVT